MVKDAPVGNLRKGGFNHFCGVDVRNHLKVLTFGSIFGAFA